MSRFSLSSDMNFDYDRILSTYKKRYNDNMLNIYKCMSFNSNINDLTFLYLYIADCFNKYQSLIESFDMLKDKNDITDYMAEIWKLTEDTVDFYNNNACLENTLRFFVNNFLKLIYQDIEFVIINFNLDPLNIYNTYKIVVEPVVLSDNNLIEITQAEDIVELITNMLSFNESDNNFVSVSVIQSNLWCNKINTPEIISDGIIPHLFENQLILQKLMFKTRYLLHQSYGLNTTDLSTFIKLSEENNRKYLKKLKVLMDYNNYSTEELDIDIESDVDNSEEEYYNSVRFEYENDQFTYAVEKLYNDINKEAYNIINREDKESLNNISNEVFKILGEFKNQKNNHSKNTNLKENEENISEEIKNIDITNVLNYEDQKCDNDGYVSFVPDYYSNKEVESIFKFKDYFNDIIKISLHNNNINSELLEKIVTGYDKKNINILTINKLSNGYSIEMGTSFDESHNYRFTISEESGIIENITIMK